LQELTITHMVNLELTVVDDQAGNPWYKEFWAWFVRAPLLVTIVLSSIMVTTAVKFGDDEITDEYYKKGRMINQRLEQVEEAKALGLAADIKFDLEIGDLILKLNSNQKFLSTPDELTLYLDHPVSQELDRVLILKEFAPGSYRADLDTPPRNRWYLRLVPGAHQANEAIDPKNPNLDKAHLWRLNGEIDFNSTSETQLKAS